MNDPLFTLAEAVDVAYAESIIEELLRRQPSFTFEDAYKMAHAHGIKRYLLMRALDGLEHDGYGQTWRRREHATS